MKIGVVTFPGSNCDADARYGATVTGNEAVPLWHKDESLPLGLDAIILPGGFSYGDYLRTGAIARFSPIMNEVIRFANDGGLVPPPAADMPVEAVGRHIELAPDEPLGVGWLPIQDPSPRGHPFEGPGLVGPEGFSVLVCGGIEVEAGIGRRGEGGGGRKPALLVEQS